MSDFIMEAHKQIQALIAKVKELEEELERKDEMHVFEIRLLRDHLTNVIKSYKLD